jgi:Rrf2 family nitric oxide-sensitive transcriptional repressor
VQLTSYSDYAFRTLIALACVAPEKLTASEISEGYDISQHHLLKVIQKLAELGFVATTRGKSGGVRLAALPQAISLGAVVRGMEPELGVVACLRPGDTPCAIASACGLKAILSEATHDFLAVLDRHTLADALHSTARVGRLLKLRVPM